MTAQASGKLDVIDRLLLSAANHVEHGYLAGAMRSGGSFFGVLTRLLTG